MFFGESFELLYVIAHDVGRNRESQSLSRNALRRERHLGRADSHEPPGNIDDRSAAVAGINRCVGLDKIFVVDVANIYLALGCAQHAAADRTAVADSVADHEYRF